MKYLRSGTASYVTLGPFIGSSDGFTIKNSLGSTAELISLVIDSATGGLPTLAMDSVPGTTNAANDVAIIAGCDAGFYSFELTSANLAYTGRGYLGVINTTHLPVWEPVHLLSVNIFDALFAGTSAGQDYLEVDTRQVGGTTQTARDLGASVLLSSGTGAGQVNLSSGNPYVLLTSGAGVGAVLLSTGYLSADLYKIAGSTVSSTSAQLGANAVQVGGTAQTTGDLAALLVDIEGKVDDLEGRTPPLAVINGTVVADAGNSTAQFMCDLVAATTSYYKDCLVLFTDGGLAGQVKEITGYSTDKIISVTPSFTSEPTTGAAFSIINR